MNHDINPLIRRAQDTDVSDLIHLRREAEQWLNERQIDQWTDKWTKVGEEKIRRAVRQQRAWVVEIANHITATVTLGGPDEDLWKVEDGPALYLYKLIVARDYAGHDLGSLIIDWACNRASEYQYPWLRLDVWRNNLKLQDYYRKLGFIHVRTVILPHRDTGSLFQRPAKRMKTNLAVLQ
jgi:ribosomal protein S18 acetylase RimI-like enzyme